MSTPLPASHPGLLFFTYTKLTVWHVRHIVMLPSTGEEKKTLEDKRCRPTPVKRATVNGQSKGLSTWTRINMNHIPPLFHQSCIDRRLEGWRLNQKKQTVIEACYIFVLPQEGVGLRTPAPISHLLNKVYDHLYHLCSEVPDSGLYWCWNYLFYL